MGQYKALVACFLSGEQVGVKAGGGMEREHLNHCFVLFSSSLPPHTLFLTDLDCPVVSQVCVTWYELLNSECQHVDRIKFV